MTPYQKQVGGGLVPGSLRGIIGEASTEGAGAEAQDAAIDQPDREPVFPVASQ